MTISWPIFVLYKSKWMKKVKMFAGSKWMPCMKRGSRISPILATVSSHKENHLYHRLSTKHPLPTTSHQTINHSQPITNLHPSTNSCQSSTPYPSSNNLPSAIQTTNYQPPIICCTTTNYQTPTNHPWQTTSINYPQSCQPSTTKDQQWTIH